MNTTISEMMLPILLVGVVGLLFGSLIGAVIASAGRANKSSAQKSPGKNLLLVFSVWRDRRNGRLVVRLDEDIFSQASGFSNRQRSSFENILSELDDWIGRKTTGPASSFEAPVSKMTETGKVDTSVGVGVSPSVTNAPPKSQTEFLAQISTQQPTPIKRTDEPSSMIAQIDEILQGALPHTFLKNRSIRLVEKPGQGMQVVVDGKAYEGIGDVPEEPVRLLIQRCVRHWEKQA